MHSLLHDIPWFLILFLGELFLIFNQMLSIRAFGRRDASIVFYELFFGHLLERLKKKKKYTTVRIVLLELLSFQDYSWIQDFEVNFHPWKVRIGTDHLYIKLLIFDRNTASFR